MSSEHDSATPAKPAVIAGQRSVPLELVSCEHDVSTPAKPAVIAGQNSV